MNNKKFIPTREQAVIISHDGSAFVSACPGAGKTRVLVERARTLLSNRATGRGIAFLSFTIAAVAELEARLRHDRLIDTPPYPNFIGTFDSFIWQYLVAPFGAPQSKIRPRLVPDKDEYIVQPYPQAMALPLKCFDRITGLAIPDMLLRYGFKGKINAHEKVARNTRIGMLERGELDFSDARDTALARLRNPSTSFVLASAFAGRFSELVVDEAQDCNPIDLEIISWFRTAGISVKVICDPHQSIYGFRGGVNDELFAFAQTFADHERLPLTGNFRSSRHIANAICGLRVRNLSVDEAVGEHRNEPTPVYIFSYAGRQVPASISAKFRELTKSLGFEASECPVLAATRLTGARALGIPTSSGTQELSCRLALAVTKFHFSFELGGRTEALVQIHKIVLEIQGLIVNLTYHQYMSDASIDGYSWRPHVLTLVESLRYNPNQFATPEAWLDAARLLLAPLLPVSGPSINQRLRRNTDLKNILATAPSSGHAARTIHSVKGMEFPAVCLVMSIQTAKEIIDCLSTEVDREVTEDVRKIYVGASRAQRLLVIAAPKSQGVRLKKLLLERGASIELVSL